MQLNAFLNGVLIFAFMVLVGYCISMSVQSGSLLGLILAIISLGAGVYFLYLLAKARYEAEQEESHL